MPGITDPCERSLQRDILDYLSAQQREDLTKKAQKYLRNLAFREIHLVSTLIINDYLWQDI